MTHKISVKIIFLLICLFGFNSFLYALNSTSEKGIELFDQKKYKEAKELFISIIKKEPKNSIAAYYLGRIAFTEEDYEKASEWFEKAADTEKNNSVYHLWLGKSYAQEARSAGVLRQPFIARKMKSSLERAISLDPDNIEARFFLMGFFQRAPGIMGGGMEKAKEQAAEIKKRNSFQGHIAFGNLYEHEKNLTAAEQEYKEAVKKHPDSLSAYYNLGIFYSNHNRYEEAFKLFDDLLVRKPDEIKIYYYIGRTGAVSGLKLPESEQALIKFLKHDPLADKEWQVAAHWRLGMVYEKKGDLQNAKKEYNNALKLNPDHKQTKEALKKLK